MLVDKKQIARQFSRAAPQYDQAAIVQNKMADALYGLLPESLGKPNRVLDLGCGTGYLTAKLAHKYSCAEVVGLDIAGGMLDSASKFFVQDKKATISRPTLVQGDIEALPIDANSCDLIVSNAALQWTNFATSLQEIERALVPGGCCLIGTFMEGTLQEWHKALARAERNLSHLMPPQVFFERCVEHAGLAVLQASSEEYLLPHSSAQDLLKSTKEVGATNAQKDRSRGLMGKQSYQNILSALELEFAANNYYSRYRSLYLLIQKASQ